jgi:hypothetical protein
MLDRVCRHCGTGFRVFPSKLKVGPADFCSRRCAYAFRKRPLAERFWEKVEKTDGCWLWAGSKRKTGYGSFSVGPSVSEGAHRVAYRLAFGPVPDGCFVLHRCDNPQCVRPDHLFLGSHLDNMADMRAKGRQPKPDHHGEKNATAKLTESAVREIRQLFRSGKASVKAVAAEYGVTEGAIRHILSGLTWSHVA